MTAVSIMMSGVRMDAVIRKSRTFRIGLAHRGSPLRGCEPMTPRYMPSVSCRCRFPMGLVSSVSSRTRGIRARALLHPEDVIAITKLLLSRLRSNATCRFRWRDRRGLGGARQRSTQGLQGHPKREIGHDEYQSHDHDRSY
jgi:hypothetical protein